MDQPDQIVPVIGGANVPLSIRKKCFSGWVILALLLALCAARAEGPDDDYLAIYNLIDQADTLNASGNASQALAKYVQAQRALAQFQRDNPGWNVKTVSFRLDYLAGKIAATSGQAVAPDNNSTNAVKKEAASAPKSQVKLLDAGSEPRTVLRLHPKVGDKQTVNMTMKMAMTMSVAGKEMPATAIPAMLLTMDVGVKDVSAAGDITYETVFGDVTLAADTDTMPAVAAAMKSSLASVRGVIGTGRMSDHGFIKGFDMKLPPGADPQLSQTMDQMKESFFRFSTPLPEEAVGPGARWEYKTKLKSGGMTIDQTATYELVSIEGGSLTFRSTIAQNAANQKIQNPAAPGLKADLNKMTGAGAGGSTFDLAHIMPVTGTLDEKTEVVMSVDMGQQKQTMDMKTDMNITIESK
jgi:hypothetical protein